MFRCIVCNMFIFFRMHWMHDKLHQAGHCIVCIHRDNRCYSPALELIVNVWPFHSAWQMIYLNPAGTRGVGLTPAACDQSVLVQVHFLWIANF